MTEVLRGDQQQLQEQECLCINYLSLLPDISRAGLDGASLCGVGSQ